MAAQYSIQLTSLKAGRINRQAATVFIDCFLRHSDGIYLTFHIEGYVLSLRYASSHLKKRSDKICSRVVSKEGGRAYHSANHALLIKGCCFRTNQQQLKNVKDAG